MSSQSSTYRNNVLPGTGRSDLNLGNFALPEGFSPHRRSHRMSELASKTARHAPGEEEHKGSKFLAQAGFIDKTASGIYSLLPLGLRVVSKIEAHVRAAMQDLGSQEVQFPVLQPKHLLQATNRWNVDVLYKLKGKEGKDSDFSLAFTHEEACADFFGKRITSYRDLPLSVFQLASKFRDEARARSGLIRGKEFKMKDMYSAHPDQASLDAYYDLAHLKYMQLYKLFGLGEATYLTYASGGDYSKFSHEYQAVCPIGEDTIYIFDESGIAINKEIFEDLDRKCPVTGSGNFREVRAVEVGNIFKLGTRFTDAYDKTYVGADGQHHPIYMASYGIGITRIIGTVAELASDDKGLSWSPAISPYSAHLVQLTRDPANESRASDIFSNMDASGLEVLFDDRSEVKPGAKFADADLIGIPFRVVVSDKTLAENKVEIKRRNESGSGRLVNVDAAINEIRALQVKA